jgi:pseudaminic acid synthase
MKNSRVISLKTNNKIYHIGKNYPVFIVAEMSGNHNHSLKKALEIIDAAAYAGVDALKLQTYTPDTITMKSKSEPFRIKMNNIWNGMTLYDLYKKAYTPWEWHKEIKEYGEKKGLIVFSTPFDETAIDFLERLDVSLYKVASYEITHIPLLKKIGQTGKPVIMSRGMASVKEIKEAISTLRKAGSKDICVLHCVSNYPALPENMNLRTIPDIAKRFGVESGLSDHSLGINISIAATAIGAKVIEKHLTLKRADGGVDSHFSLEPDEFKRLVESVREVEKALGKPSYKRSKDEEVGAHYRRSLFVVKNIKKGETLTPENIRCIRPGDGMLPKYYEKVLGKVARKDIKGGTPLTGILFQKK